MAQTPLRCLQRASSCWGVMLREANSAPGGGAPRITVLGVATTSRRMVHNPAGWHSSRRSMSHYDVLKVSPHATQDQIKKAYYKMSLEHHPDLHGGSIEASEKFRHISEAYEVLGDPLKRSDYDAVYGSNRHTSSDQDRAERDSIFRRPRRTGKTKFNMDAWEEAHYGRHNRTNPPDWRRRHSPHNWWHHHGPRVSPDDAARFWDQEMARKYGGGPSSEQQRKMMEERMKELRNMHRSAMIVLISIFFLASFLNFVFDDHDPSYVRRTNQRVDK
ncbi:DnaJ domain [Trinorchestia longiramus]|nr:DnaJ domain [Trinorchestia longiramus]